MKKRALIIGITGQDGSYLAKTLLEKDYNVFGTSRDHEVSSFKNLKQLQIKEQVRLTSMVTSDFRSVITVLQKANADEIYNLAGQTSVGMSFDYPVETFDSILRGTLNLLECIRILKKPVRFYNAGSSECFGNTKFPANEKTPFQPRSPYATAKAAAHFAVANYRESYGIFASSGILFNHESPLRPVRFVTKKIVSTAVRIAQGSREKLTLGNLNVQRDWGWAPDYVDAMWRILQHGAPDDFVICSGQSHSLKEFVGEVFSYLGLAIEDHLQIKKELYRPSDLSQSLGNPAKAKKLLGWKAKVRFKKLIEELVLAEIKIQAASAKSEI